MLLECGAIRQSHNHEAAFRYSLLVNQRSAIVKDVLPPADVFEVCRSRLKTNAGAIGFVDAVKNEFHSISSQLDPNL